MQPPEARACWFEARRCRSLRTTWCVSYGLKGIVSSCSQEIAALALRSVVNLTWCLLHGTGPAHATPIWSLPRQVIPFGPDHRGEDNAANSGHGQANWPEDRRTAAERTLSACRMEDVPARDKTCPLEPNDFPLNIAVAKLGQGLVDFMPGGYYAPLVKVKTKKLRNSLQRCARPADARA